MATFATVGLFAAVFWLAWSNGANDNFKGVATLYGSGTASFRRALAFATITTLLGSMVSVYLADTLVKRFSGAGIVPAEQIDGAWLIAVAAAGGATILLATVLGMPTSTTHALIGALVGAGIMTNPAGIHWNRLWIRFAQPLLLSPVAAIGATVVLYPLVHRVRRAMGVDRQTCVCIGNAAPQPVVVRSDGSAVQLAADSGHARVEIGKVDRCVERYDGNVVGFDAQSAVDTAHYLSAGAVCLARAVNDTPKIAALILAAGAVTGSVGISAPLAMVAGAMALGGLLHARRVAETMSRRVTTLNPGQGLTANLVTSALVLTASRWGMPVSTTHVSCGSILGIGLVNRRAQWKTVARIAVTWLTTLPMGALLGAGFCWLLRTAM